MRVSQLFTSNFSTPEVAKLLRNGCPWPGAFGSGRYFSNASDCGHKRLAGIVLLGKACRPTPVLGSPVNGSKIMFCCSEIDLPVASVTVGAPLIGNRYSLKLPVRASAVGTEVVTEEPNRRRVSCASPK